MEIANRRSSRPSFKPPPTPRPIPATMFANEFGSLKCMGASSISGVMPTSGNCSKAGHQADGIGRIAPQMPFPAANKHSTPSLLIFPLLIAPTGIPDRLNAILNAPSGIPGYAGSGSPQARLRFRPRVRDGLRPALARWCWTATGDCHAKHPCLAWQSLIRRLKVVASLRP